MWAERGTPTCPQSHANSTRASGCKDAVLLRSCLWRRRVGVASGTAPPHFLRHVPEVPHAQVSPQLNPLCKHTPIPAPHAPSLPQRDAVAQVPVSACYGNAEHTPAPLPHNLCDSLPTLGAVADDSAPWLWDEPWRKGATHRSTLMCVGIPGASRTGRLGATLLGMPTGLWVSQCVIPVGNLPGVAPPGP